MDTKLQQPKEGSNFTVTLTLSSLITIGVASAVVLTAFFVLGVLIGRGYQPEQSVPKLASIMPKPPVADNSTEEENPVLEAKELHFADSLQANPAELAGLPEKKGKEEKKVKKTAKRPPNVQPSVATEKREITRPNVTESSWVHKGVPEESLAGSKKSAATASASVKKSAPVKIEESASGGEIYDYRYQVASFKELDRAREFQQKLERLDLFSELEYSDIKKARWYRVLVLHRGSPESTRTMKNKLAKLGIKKPLLKTKTARN